MNGFYIIGSLRNQEVVDFGNAIRALGYEAFDEWISPGPDADDFLRDYGKKRGLNYKQTLQTYAAKHIFDFDKSHLERLDAAVMLMPAGKSGHLELGYVRGLGKPAYIVFDKEPDRIDIMLRFATEIFFSQEEFFQHIKEKYKGEK